MHVGLGLQFNNLDAKTSDAEVYRRELALAACDEAQALRPASWSARLVRAAVHLHWAPSERQFGRDLRPELQLGVLGSCLTHVFLIQAADRGVPLDALEVEVSGQIDPRGGQPGYEHIPVYPHDIAYTVHIASPASDEEIAALHEAVERACPILNLLANPQQIAGRIERQGKAIGERQ